MTDQETTDELIDILKYKCKLTGKIDHNAAEIDRLSILLDSEKDALIRAALNKEIRKGESIVSAQVTERVKLSANKIALSLGLKIHKVRYQERVMLGVRF